jgi:hypothetical protein
LSNLALAIAVKGQWDADRLYNQLRAAGVTRAAEIHVACDPGHVPGDAPPSFSIHSLADASLFELWGVAIAASEAPWVAILHADSPPAPGWFAAMNEAMGREGWRDGYWGPVEPQIGGSDARMVGYLTEYCQFHRPLAPGLKEVPGNNLVLPRERMDNSSDFSKTRLLRQGLAPRYAEDAVVLYARPFRFGDYCGRRYRHGRAYAATRVPRMSLLKALPQCSALPVVRTARVLHHAWRHKHLRGPSLRWLPLIFVAECCWSAGELSGYVTRRPGSPAALD